MTFDVQFLTFLVGTVVPIVVGVLAHSRASAALKGFLNLTLSALAGVVIVLIARDGVWTAAVGVGAFYAWVASVGTYFGFLKPAGIAAAVAKAVPGGVGKPQPKLPPSARSDRIG